MNNLNSVSADDYMTGPRQQTGTKGFQATTYKQGESPTTPVANKRKTTNPRQTSNNNGSNSIRSRNTGALINSGGNYTGDRYNIKQAGFGNTQQQAQVRKSANEYRNQYTMRQQKGKPNGKPIVTNLRQQQTAPKISVQTVQASKPINIKPQSSSSSDLKPVDTRKIDYATEIHNITVYNIPDEAYHLSDRDNKIQSTYAGPGRTTLQQAQLMNKDRMNGFSSFNNRQKWEDIYSYEYYKTVKTSRTVTKKRN